MCKYLGFNFNYMLVMLFCVFIIMCFLIFLIEICVSIVIIGMCVGDNIL